MPPLKRGISTEARLEGQLYRLVAACRSYHDETGHEDKPPAIRCDWICEEMKKAEALLDEVDRERFGGAPVFEHLQGRGSI